MHLVIKNFQGVEHILAQGKGAHLLAVLLKMRVQVKAVSESMIKKKLDFNISLNKSCFHF